MSVEKRPRRWGPYRVQCRRCYEAGVPSATSIRICGVCRRRHEAKMERRRARLARLAQEQGE